ncbi:hypothetical protein LPAF129_15930 [Ligilactobacillus pabuli]|uniref:Uncharacterized protein n=1 Tax=Ligilactobacillus pabuli TaxID=2886039 RepID=A0ABQ5JKC6_9LACO|nr:hypothetical protein LPAF129_15930 [Ligilactobacillus pabuli]
MDLLINILLIFLAIIVLVLGTYLFKNRHRPFLVFHPETERGLGLFCTVFGVLMILCGCLTLLTLFYAPTWLLIVVIASDVLTSFIVPFVLWGYTL